MLKQSEKKVNDNETRLNKCIENLWFPVIEKVPFMSLAFVPSLSNNDTYTVTIFNLRAAFCNCKGKAEFHHDCCIHMQAVDAVLAPEREASEKAIREAKAASAQPNKRDDAPLYSRPFALMR